MFDEGSRYANLATSQIETGDGRTITYVRRRFVPAPASYLEGARHRVTDSDRVDLISHRSLGVSTAYWLLADANEVVHPDELTGEVGASLIVPVPTGQGLAP